MKVIESAREIQRFTSELRAQGKRIAFIPTMGALHEGHLSLLREGRRHSDLLILSIFINPTQFGPNEDLDRYPRNLEGDLKKAKACETAILFTPTPEQIYPKGYETFVSVEKLSTPLCGKSRPGHFKGVATVVLKLFNLIQPHSALFGEKDFQQLVMIKRMVTDLNLPIEIIGMPIVREPDGLAMSSRNVSLSQEERERALSLSRALVHAQELVANNVQNSATILAAVREILESAKLVIDYVNIVDPATLQDVATTNREARLCIAAFVGKTRLIDNCTLGGLL